MPQPNTFPATAAAGLVVPVLGRQIGLNRELAREVLTDALNFSSTRLAFLGCVMLFRTPKILLQEMVQGEFVFKDILMAKKLDKPVPFIFPKPVSPTDAELAQHHLHIRGQVGDVGQTVGGGQDVARAHQRTAAVLVLRRSV